MDRRTFLRTTAGFAALATVGALETEALASQAGLVRVRTHTVPFLGAVHWQGQHLRIAQLSDIHIGWGTPPETLAAAQRLAHAAQPDLLVLTGDFLNHSLVEADALVRWLAGLPRPAVATLGNHDHWSGALGIRRILEQQGIPVLQNESLALDLGGQRLTLAGVDDGFTHHDDAEKAFGRVALPDHALVLSHEPRTADRIARTGGRLVLSGHTHGGQVVLPGVTRMITAMAGMRYVAGWYQAGDAQLYVNAGIGSSVRLARVGEQAMPELAVFDLG